jgi:hypothetical protein
MECKSCGREHDVNRGGWIILATKDLICDPADKPECWEQLSDWYIQKRAQMQALHDKNNGLTNAKTAVR